MRKIQIGFIAILTILFNCIPVISQKTPAPAVSSFNDMQSIYTGNVSYDAGTKTVTFESTGTMAFTGRTEQTDNIWHIPSEITKVIIKAGVTVTGQFTWGHNMTFEGEDQKTSVLYGTSKTSSLHDAGLDDKYSCVAYSSFYGYGNGDNYIKNLTCLNPLGFMFTGKGCRLHLDGVRGIDNRGGNHNHSDGISAASGSTVKNSYLETGDDAIKVYADILVENTEIVMVQNCIPIQYTWGKYGSGAKGTFKNVKITGTKGRGTIRAVFNLASKDCGANYSKTIVMDGCIIDNPNATLFHMKDNNVESNVTITNSKINVKTYGSNFGTGTINICGSSAQSKAFDCYDNSSSVDENTVHNYDYNVFPNPFKDILQIESDSPIYYLADISGRVVLNPLSEQGLNLYTFNTQNLENGMYLLIGAQNITKVVKSE